MWFDQSIVRGLFSVTGLPIKPMGAVSAYVSVMRVPCFVLALVAPAALLTDAAVVHADEGAPPPASAPALPRPATLRRSTDRTENSESIAPLAQLALTIYAPQSVPLSAPAMNRSWKEGDPVPDGYHATTRVRNGAVVGGSVLLGALYFISSFSAAASVDAAKAHNTTSDDIPLFVPAIGPFIRMATISSAIGGYALAIDGAGQLAGLALLIYGLAVPKTVLVRNDLGKAIVLPMQMGQGGYGAGVRAAF